MALGPQLRARHDDPQAIAVRRSMMTAFAEHPVPEPFDIESYADLLPPASATIARVLLEHSIEPLNTSLTQWVAANGPAEVNVNNRDYELIAQDSNAARQDWPTREDWFTLAAPLTRHACPELIGAVGDMLYLVFDPGKERLLDVEQAHYARERAKLIQIEHGLWQRAHEHGGPTDLIPYATRVLLLLFSWHPSAHEPPGAWTLCVRCGELIHRKKRSFATLPRCTTCMKETPQQRQWPAHAMAPHDKGRWFLSCQYPDCDQAFTGPRHRKLCPEHTSSKLPPGRRLTAKK